MCNLCQNLKNEDYRNIILELEKGNEKSFPFTIFLISFRYDNFLPIRNRCICTVFRDRFVSRADDLVYVDELLNTVGAPAGDTGAANIGVKSSSGRSSMVYTKPL